METSDAQLETIPADPTERFSVALAQTRRKGTPLAVGVMTARAVTRRFQVPRRDHRSQTGYQRDVSKARVNKLVSDLQSNRVDLPTAVLLNLRDFDPSVHLIEEANQHFFVPGSSPLYVVDGQHRLAALSRLIEANEDEWGGFQIPFACMLGADPEEELEQFYFVNSTAKSVRTDLAFDLLKQRAENDPTVMQGILESGQSWKIDGERLCEKLAKTEIWRNRIRFPGEPKSGTTINNSGMVNSLKALLTAPYFGALSVENQLHILDAYWRGLREVLPEAFHDPTDYTLQKVTGVQVMHLVLIPLIEYVRSVGDSVADPDSYADVLREPLANLQETTADEAIVSGSNFWRAGPEGAAGSFSSNAGRRVLSARIRSALPAPEIA
jgi:DGQHR domain-containing protein